MTVPQVLGIENVQLGVTVVVWQELACNQIIEHAVATCKPYCSQVTLT